MHNNDTQNDGEIHVRQSKANFHMAKNQHKL